MTFLNAVFKKKVIYTMYPIGCETVLLFSAGEYIAFYA